MRPIIEKILAAAINAPSGENAQPWKFGIKGDKLYVYNLPERDQSLYNDGQCGSYVAHGALLENIALAATAFGLRASFDLFPDPINETIVAIVSFVASQPKEDALYTAISKRTTNRKPYSKLSLTDAERSALLTAGDTTFGQVLLAEDRQAIETLGLVGGMNERLVFENELLHTFLFSHITWTEAEAAEKKIGFYLKTLEMPLPARLGFKLFRHWSVVRQLNKVGLSKAIWKQNSGTYAASSAIGIVVVNGTAPADFVAAGRITERLWLTATNLGLSFQPMTGILFFMQRIMAGHAAAFSSEQIELIKNSFADVKRIFSIQDGAIPMMFRIGHSTPPSACSPKLSPMIEEL